MRCGLNTPQSSLSFKKTAARGFIISRTILVRFTTSARRHSNGAMTAGKLAH